MITEGVLELTDRNFAEHVGKGIVLVDFWAPWCGPCRVQGPIIEQLAAEIGGKAAIAKVNVDDAPMTSGQLGIRSIPTLILFKDGKPVDGFVGVQNTATLTAAIDEAAKA
ncbi:MAG: thioredoxin [Verrucomicrobia bacterium]|nr:thioredoxin [Verrucomicrobiota bacterium]